MNSSSPRTGLSIAGASRQRTSHPESTASNPVSPGGGPHGPAARLVDVVLIDLRAQSAKLARRIAMIDDNALVADLQAQYKELKGQIQTAETRVLDLEAYEIQAKNHQWPHVRERERGPGLRVGPEARRTDRPTVAGRAG